MGRVSPGFYDNFGSREVGYVTFLPLLLQNRKFISADFLGSLAHVFSDVYIGAFEAVRELEAVDFAFY